MKTTVRPNNLRRLLTKGKSGVGPNLQIPSPELVEMIALAGFDYVLLDGEHGAALTRLPELLLACDVVGLTSIVRVPSHDRSVLLPPLELGACGLQVPMVETAAQARRLVWETKYAPLGGRGMSMVSRAARFGFSNRKTYCATANRETMLVVQLETQQAVENAAEIAAVPGVDMIFIGPADLAQSFGEPAYQLTPRVRRVIREVIRQVVPRKPVGISALSTREVAQWHALGVRCFLTSSARPLGQALHKLRTDLQTGMR